MPTISVILPVYNGAKYLKEALESILEQSFSDFELIIINDGSTDQSEKIIESFTDPRIVYIKNPENLGLAKSFNIGIKAAKGAYIARMDADDVSLSHRFASQVEYLKSHPEAGVIGTAVTLMDGEDRTHKKHFKPLTHLKIKWQSLFSVPVFHPTVMARAEVLKENLFDESLFNSEDYELWSRLIFDKGVCFANLSQPLLFYRVFKHSFTRSLDPEKRLASARNSIKNIERYKSLSEKQKKLIESWRLEEKLSFSDLARIYYLYLGALFAFRRKEKLSFNAFMSLYLTMPRFKLSLLKHKIKQILR